MNGDAVVARAQDGMNAIDPAERRTAVAGRSLVV
jgi:hypothetical protein